MVFDRRRIEKLKKMIDTGVPIRNWGIVTKMVKLIILDILV